MTMEKKTFRSDIPGHNAWLGLPQDESRRRLTVGRGITVEGKVSACEHLVVEGEVHVKDLAVRRLDILDSGLLTGPAFAQDAVIAGRLEGRLTVPGRLVVKATGHITGEIEYGALEIENGGRIEGTARPRTAEAEAQQAADNVETLFSVEITDAPQRPKIVRRVAGS
jgi:cytoskeletal protein CcmA (bactofilin family)